MPYGTLSVLDSLASSQQTIAQFGEDRAFEAIQTALDAHNAQFREMASSLVDITVDRQRRYGGPADMTMEEKDEFGRAQAQKVTAGATIGFPLRLYDISVQWTWRFMMNGTTRELAAQFTAAQDADVKLLIRQIKRAMHSPTNYTFVDRLVDHVELPVKAFVNADGAAIPPSPEGVAFNGATHTHYLFTPGTTLVAASLISLIDTVVEHHNTGLPVVWIAKAQEAAVMALSGFTAYVDARIIPATTAASASRPLDIQNPNNRAIGLFNGAEVWVKPFMVPGYLFAYVAGAMRPFVMRERVAGAASLTMAAEDQSYPLRCRTLEREFGIGIWTRTNGAVLYIDTGAAGAYVAPVIT